MFGADQSWLTPRHRLGGILQASALSLMEPLVEVGWAGTVLMGRRDSSLWGL